MPRRASKRLAKQASRKGGKRQSRPNVFVPRPAPVRETGDETAPAVVEAAPEDGSAMATGRGRETVRPRMGRSRQIRARSEVYTQYLPQELRKIGVLALGIVAVLTVLTVILR